ncbi:MAG: DUF554 domain-containing protein [Coriobacteriia bacterium]|nr:DUF554 domain-containing protein [Coriobacteriia bacterium]
MFGLGVIANVVAVLVGTAIGLLFGGLIPERMRETTFRAIGLAVIVIGLGMSIGGLTQMGQASGMLGRYSALVFVGSLVIGALIGEALRIEYWLERFGHRLQDLSYRMPWLAPTAKSASDEPGEKGHTLVEGFVTASLLFCVGAMTVLGSIQDGLGDPSTLYLKAMLDGLASIALASTLGAGVGLSVIPILIIQGGIALTASQLSGVTPETVAAIEAVGGALIAAIGLDLTGIKRLPVGNLLPAVFVAMALAVILS